jgi:fatty-acyl-CoA synthase
VGRLLVGDIIDAAAARSPGSIAVVHDGRQLTFAEVAEGADRLAAVLLERGLGHGDRIVWWGYNTVDAVRLYFATAHIGAVLVPLNPSFGDDEAKPLFELADASLVVSDDRHPGDVSLAELLAQQPAGTPRRPDLDEDDAHMIFFTSGTTGRSKGVVLSHRTEVIRSMLGGMSTWPRGATICMFPQFHMAGWASTLEAWISSETVVYVDGGDTEQILGAVDRYRGYRLYCIPAVWRRVLDMDRSAWDLSCVGQADTGTSATTPALLREIRETFPWTTTTITYGSTEAGLVSRMGPEDVLRKHGSVGPPGPTVFVRLDEGELAVRSGHLASGYFRNQEATDEAFRPSRYSRRGGRGCPRRALGRGGHGIRGGQPRPVRGRRGPAKLLRREADGVQASPTGGPDRLRPADGDDRADSATRAHRTGTTADAVGCPWLKRSTTRPRAKLP